MLRSPRASLLALGAALVTGCALFDDDPSLILTIATDRANTAPDAPATLTVTAVNPSGARVVWGTGSSGCQLGAVVAVSPYVWRRAVGPRACTDDEVEQGLDPGAARTEQFPWDGRVAGETGVVLLLPGTYELRGAAGERSGGRAVRLALLAPELLTGRVR